MVCYRAGSETGHWIWSREEREGNTVKLPTDSQGVPSGIGEWDKAMTWEVERLEGKICMTRWRWEGGKGGHSTWTAKEGREDTVYALLQAGDETGG